MPGLGLVKRTKIVIPRRRPDFLRRQRLVDFLHSRIDRRLLLVSAPAGYGKTTLLVDFATDTEVPVCWCSLDSAAQEPRVFLEHFVACIQQRFPGFGQQTVQALDRVSEFTNEGLNPVLVSIVNEILDEIPEYFAIILDDFHLVEQSPAVAGFVTRFLEDAPENCCLIVAGRTVSGKLPIVALASKQQVAGLGSNDLRFTAEEVETLIKQIYDVDIGPEEAQALAQDSEGWITGILLSTHSLWQGLLKGMIRARGTMTVYDYLASEVFNQQDSRVQDFLLGTSILEDMSAELCDAVLGIRNSWAMLNLLEERNLFLNRMGGDGQWYRYHRLFQGYLVSRLRRENPQRFAALNRQAAAYWEGKGDLLQAISHLLMAGEYENAAARMERAAPQVFISGQHLLLVQWHEALPAPIAERHPSLLIPFAKAYAQHGQEEQALSLLDRAQALFKEQREFSGVALAAVQKATVLRIQGRYQEAAELCAQTALLPKTEASTVAENQRCWGICLGQAGRLAEAVEHLTRALEQHQRHGDEFNAAHARTDLGAFLERMGRLDEALAHFEKAVETFRRFRNPSELANALNSVGVIYYYRGEYGRARETLLQALQAAQQAGSGRWTAYILAGLGDIERDESHVSEALDHYGKALSLLDEKREGFLSVYIRAAQAELYAAQDEPLRALDLARQSLELASSHQSSYEEGLAGIALGLALMEKEPDRALQALERAAGQLQRNGAMREMTRALFLLSAALYRIGSRDQALARLRESLASADRLGYRNALHALGRCAQPLLAHAAQSGIDVAGFSSPMDRIEPSDAATPVDSVRPYSITLQGLGASRVELDGEALVAKWGKARELIFLLATENQGRGMMREDIFGALWPDVPSPKAYSNLHTLVYRVRRFVRLDCISFEDNVYRFAPPGGYAYDVAEFQRCMAEAQEARTEEEAIASYQNAIALYQGDFLKDLLAEWSFSLQRAFRDMFLIAISTVADSYWRAGKTDMAMALAHRWLDEEPDDEAAHRLLMRSFAAQGNIAAVRRQFQQCEQLLARDLQVEPDEETRTLYLSLTGETPGR